MAKVEPIIGKWSGGQVVFDVPLEREKLAGLEDGQILEIRPYATPSAQQYRLLHFLLKSASEATGVNEEEIKNRAKASGGYTDGPAIQIGDHLFQPLKSTSAMSMRELAQFIEDVMDFVSIEYGVDVGAMRRDVQSRMAMRRW